MVFTKEQREILAQYENNLKTAYFADWVRIETRKAVDEMDKVFHDAYGQTSGLHSACSRCVIRDVKRLGKDYFADLKELAEKKEKAEAKKVAAEKNKAATNKNTKGKTAPKKNK